MDYLRLLDRSHGALGAYIAMLGMSEASRDILAHEAGFIIGPVSAARHVCGWYDLALQETRDRTEEECDASQQAQ